MTGSHHDASQWFVLYISVLLSCVITIKVKYKTLVGSVQSVNETSRSVI